jgi:hypothetical protein
VGGSIDDVLLRHAGYEGLSYAIGKLKQHPAPTGGGNHIPERFALLLFGQALQYEGDICRVHAHRAALELTAVLPQEQGADQLSLPL